MIAVIYRVEDKVSLHALEISSRVKNEDSIIKKIKEFLEKEYEKRPILIIQGKYDFIKGFDDDVGWVNNLGIGKIYYKMYKKYKVVDLYDGKEVLGYAETLSEIKRIGRERLNDTDGECSIFYYPFDTNSCVYNFAKRIWLRSC